MIILVRGWDGSGRTTLAEHINRKYSNSKIFSVSVSVVDSGSQYLLHNVCSGDVRAYLTDYPHSYAIVDDCGIRVSHLDPYIAVGRFLHQSVVQVTPTEVLDALYYLRSDREIDRNFGLEMVKYHFSRSQYGGVAISVDELWEPSSLSYFNLVFLKEDGNDRHTYIC